MEFEGTYTLQVPAQEVWNCLVHEHTIQQTMPGLEYLTRLDNSTYAFAMHIRHAPLRGNYTGKANVLELDDLAGTRLKIEGEGPGNTFHGVCDIRLHAQNENTIVNYQGTFQLGRGKALIPTPLLKATIKVLLQHFFTALADQLRTEPRELVYLPILEEMYEVSFMEEQAGEQLLKTHQFHSSQEHLEAGKPLTAPEEPFIRYLRQIGIIAVLLLLVWVGTRLPRRFQGPR